MTAHGEFNWLELQTCSPERAMEFYGATIGWTFQAEKMPTGGTYWLVLASGNPIAGILAIPNEGTESPADRWVTYIHVNELDRSIETAKQHGAMVLREPWDVPGVGRVAMIRTPGDAEIGWVTPVSRAP